MLLNNVDTVLTNDLDDWYRLSKHFHRVAFALKNKGYKLAVAGVNVIAPDEYLMWIADSPSG